MASKKTMKDPSIGPVKSKKELAALLDILALTFRFTREQGEQYAAIVGEKNYRVIRCGGGGDGRSIAGGCALLPLGQFFGGRSVPMTGVAAVGVAPEHRGRGLALALMQAALREMHANGCAISSLYPATLPLYRSVGYEHAGSRHEIRIPAKSLIFKKRSDILSMRRITRKDEPGLRELYRSVAVHRNGHLDRSDFIWHRVRQPRGQNTHGFVLINPDTRRPEGYTYYVQKDGVDAAYSLHLTDLAFATPEAGRQLLCFFADHRSMSDQIVFLGGGGGGHPILQLLPERNYAVKLLDHWMLRIVDVGAALSQRGYPAGVRAQLHLNVEDDLLINNNGVYVLNVDNGTGSVQSGGRGDIQIDIRGLAALYTGHASPCDLLATGHLRLSPRIKKSEEILAAAGAVFAGPAPWMPDMF